MKTPNAEKFMDELRDLLNKYNISLIWSWVDNYTLEDQQIITFWIAQTNVNTAWMLWLVSSLRKIEEWAIKSMEERGVDVEKELKKISDDIIEDKPEWIFSDIEKILNK